SVIENPIERRGHNPVLRREESSRVKDAYVMREAKLKLRLSRLDAFVRQPVATQERHQSAGGRAQITLSRWPLAANIALVGNDGRFVDRHPEAGQLAQLVRNALGVVRE